MCCLCIIFTCVDSDKDDCDQVRAVKALCAIFTVVAKKDKEKNPLHYWLEDYEVCNCRVCCTVITVG